MAHVDFGILDAIPNILMISFVKPYTYFVQVWSRTKCNKSKVTM